jgi:hypothetical protein
VSPHVYDEDLRDREREERSLSLEGLSHITRSSDGRTKYSSTYTKDHARQREL